MLTRFYLKALTKCLRDLFNYSTGLLKFRFIEEVEMIFNMCIIHLITQVQHSSTEMIFGFYLTYRCVWLWAYLLHFIQLETDCKMPVPFKIFFQLPISLQIPNHCLLFQFT